MFLNRIVFTRDKNFKYIMRYTVKPLPFPVPQRPSFNPPPLIAIIAIVYWVFFQTFFMDL